MEKYLSTYTHQQHQNKDKNMSYYERKEREALAIKHKLEFDDLAGATAKVKRLLKLVAIADVRSNGGGNMYGSSMRKFEPEQARRLEELKKIRAELMSDSSKFFGTLDHEVIRKSYQYEALNDRQRKTILAQYKWQYEEMEPAEIPAIELDVWVNPLQDIYDTLTEKELTHFTPVHRMSIMLYKELKGRMKQPIYTIDDGSVVTIGYEPSIEEVTLPA